MTAASLIIKIELVPEKGSYSNSIHIQDVYQIVEDIMGINPITQLAVCQKGGPLAKSYKIGVKNSRIWDELNLDRFMDEQFRLTSGKLVMFLRYSEDFQEVTVKNVPPDWSGGDVCRILNFYGTVVSLKHQYMQHSERNVKADYHSVWDGNWRVKMKLTRHIPSNIIIKNTSIEIHYRHQNRTCWRCGLEHNIKECRSLGIAPRDFVNRFSWEDFPELVKKKVHKVEVRNMETEDNVEDKSGEGDEAMEKTANSGINSEHESEMETEIDRTPRVGEVPLKDVVNLLNKFAATTAEVALETPSVAEEVSPVVAAPTAEIGEVEWAKIVDLSETATEVASETTTVKVAPPVAAPRHEEAASESRHVKTPVIIPDDVMDDLIKTMSKDQLNVGNKDIAVSVVEVEVLHRDCSQVTSKILSSDETVTANTDSASEMELIDIGITPGQADKTERIDIGITPGQADKMVNSNMASQLVDNGLGNMDSSQASGTVDSTFGLMDMDFQAGATLMGPQEREAKRDNMVLSSTEDDSDGVIKFQNGTLVNSFIYSARKKKFKDDDD